MTDFEEKWPLLTRFGQHEEIMKRLATYVSWETVADSSAAERLLTHYQRDVGVLLRTLTHARTPTRDIAVEVGQFALANHLSVTQAFSVMVLVFKILNTQQGIPIAGNAGIDKDTWNLVLDSGLPIVEAMIHEASPVLPCMHCKFFSSSVAGLLQHTQEQHSQLNGENDGEQKEEAG